MCCTRAPAARGAPLPLGAAQRCNKLRGPSPGGPSFEEWRSGAAGSSDDVEATGALNPEEAPAARNAKVPSVDLTGEGSRKRPKVEPPPAAAAPSSATTSATTAPAPAAGRLEQVEGLAALVGALDASAKQAALAFCADNHISDVRGIAGADEFVNEFVGALGIDGACIGARLVRMKLAKLREAV